jgi:para-nitrobenzyl esterase
MFISKLSTKVSYSVVETGSGKLRGILKEGTHIFRGVKYAEAKRFQLPIPPAPWTGIRDALAYGYTAPGLSTRLSPEEFYHMHFYSPQGEDCQYLNIWTQHTGQGKKRPVIVWFHGGGWDSGSSIEQFAYDGEEMSRYGDIVFVSIEYRLNVFGGLDLSSFGERYKDSNRAGLEDVIFALKWIAANISAFGGDPKNITLIGHAGGAPQVMTLLQTPSADGLYRKVCLGGNIYRSTEPVPGKTRKELAQQVAEYILSDLSIAKNEIQKIETLSPLFLTKAACDAREKLKKETGVSWLFEPIPDESYTFSYGDGRELRGETIGIPMLFGGDFGDSRSNIRQRIGDCRKNEWDMNTVMDHLRAMYGQKTEEMAAAFKEAYPDKNIADVLFIDRKARYKNLALAKSHAGKGGKGWNWIFAAEFSINGGTIPWHCCDSPYITHNAQYYEASYMPGVSERLQNELCGAYVAFAEKDDPNNTLLPQWPEITPVSVPSMIFDHKTHLGINHDERLQRLLESWYEL